MRPGSLLNCGSIYVVFGGTFVPEHLSRLLPGTFITLVSWKAEALQSFNDWALTMHIVADGRVIKTTMTFQYALQTLKRVC